MSFFRMNATRAMLRTPYLVQIDDSEPSSQNDLCLRPLNVERGSERFPEKDGIIPPKVATYRSNLTALSQRRNLLFVAYDHEIYVWEPAGPRQVLGTKPTMIITPVMKEPEAEGFISRRSPHAINNILIDELGRDEILLLATDSGNVCGYHVESIFSHIDVAKSNGEKCPILNPSIDPFFCENVGLSAWGLAVHKYARLIAVSANTGIITVFAFALAEESCSEPSSPTDSLFDDLQNYGQNWLHVDGPDEFEKIYQLSCTDKHRSRNLRLSYEGHFTNIPCIDFLSCDLDSEGLWMVSTDIDNRLFVWDVWHHHTPFKVFDFSGGEPLPDVLRIGERGWSVLALDPRSFRLHQSFAEACGGKAYFRPYNPFHILDVTHLAQNVPDASFVYNPLPPVRNVNQEEPVLPDIFDRQSRIGYEVSPHVGKQSLSGADRLGTNEDYISTSDQGTREITNHLSLQQHQASSTNEPVASPSQIRQSSLPELLQILLQSGGGTFISETSSDGSNQNDSSDDEEAASDETDLELSPDAYSHHSDNHSMSSSVAEYTEQRDSPYPFSKPQSSNVTPLDFGFPILHFSETDIRLLVSPFSRYPTVIARGPLRQQVPEVISSIHGYDRFNMVKYLAEFGIVVAATQKGRAAVISLTEVASASVAIRINWMLPLASQERKAERPLKGLLGLAVGPIQGFEKQPDASHVPRGAESHQNFSFHYRGYGNDAFNVTANDSDSDCHGQVEIDNEGLSFDYPSSDGESNDQLPTECHGPSPSELPKQQKPSFTESYGIADWHCKPQEPWQGVSSSRRYRVLLTYTDHTVMSYEFWYEWSDTAVGGHPGGTEGPYEDCREDLFLL